MNKINIKNTIVFGASWSKQQQLKELGYIVATTSKQAFYLIKNNINIKTLITYVAPESSIVSSLISTIFKNPCSEAYYIPKPGAKPIEITNISYKKSTHVTNKGETQVRITYDIFQDFKEEVYSQFNVITEQEKAHYSKYIRLFDLAYPQDNLEWTLIRETINTYLNYNLPYQFDTNRYYLCEECDELVSLNQQGYHKCSSPDIDEKYSKIDRIVNGEE
jgi:hypothetical protein